MKRIAGWLLLILMVALSAAALAEGGDSAQNRGILSLMDASRAPASSAIDFDVQSLAATDAEDRAATLNLKSSNGDVLHVRFNFMLNESMTDAQWQTVEDWLKQITLSAIQTVQADAQSLASVIAGAYIDARDNAAPGETGMPAWASDALLLTRVTAAVPYYPTLSLGDKGASTQTLQKKLVELGFLNDTADGQFGENTKQAVMRLEEYVRLLETEAAASGDGWTLTVAGAETAFEPYTTVDGVADALLQAYLYSDDFQVTHATLQSGDEGAAVTRVQTRLQNLGYLTQEADGHYGGDTAYAVRLFQYFSGLNQTGVADETTQKALFSEIAAKPSQSALSSGASGDDVSKLQRRLRVLGFGAISVDGSYGSSTENGVKNLQSYMQSSGIIADAAVNGVADPMLLDAFYSDAFPAIPGAMQSGSKGIDVARLQRRLATLDYYDGDIDGAYGSGTADAVKRFQRLNGLKRTGEADDATLKALFNADAQKNLSQYQLRVSIADQRVYAYELDENLQYTKLVRTMVCSTGRSGTPTPTGTYTSSTGPGARWHYFKKFNCWAQYAFYIEGDIMFHSVLYSSKGGSVTQSSVNNLGSRASHGCVRLSVADAKWIWTNCKAHTTVVVK